jgi:hypothetical protein
MDEDRAAPAGDPWPGVVINLDDQVVKPILAPEPIAWFSGRPPKWTIVAPVFGILAPRVGAADLPKRQGGARRRNAIRPPPEP